MLDTVLLDDIEKPRSRTSAMQSLSSFDRALFVNSNPATDEFFEEQASKLFEADDGRHEKGSCIRLYVYPFLPGDYQEALDEDARPQTKTTLESTADSDNDSPLNGTLHVDQTRYFSVGPPEYVGTPGLMFEKISDANRLKEIATVKTLSCGSYSLVDQLHSYSRLQVTRDLFETLLDTFGIFPRFKEFVLLFVAKRCENEIGPPQMRFRKITKRSDSSVSRRASIGFECAYALRYVELNHRGKKNPWSLRQCAVYHKYRMHQQSSTWVLISASSNTELNLDRYIKSARNVYSLDPFEIHLILLDTALANWRNYLISITENVSKQSDRALVASVDSRGLLRPLDMEERQELKIYEDQLIDILIVLDSTLDTLISFKERYREFCQEVDAFPACHANVDAINCALEEKQREVSLSRKKVEALQTKIQGTMSLMSTILDLGNGVSLKLLVEEARNENTTTRKLIEKSAQDASAVKVLTIITLIFLPSTAVANFFSTDFVSQKELGNTTKLVIADNVWVYVAISLPFTICTVFVWWVWVQFQAGSIRLPRVANMYNIAGIFVGRARPRSKHENEP